MRPLPSRVTLTFHQLGRAALALALLLGASRSAAAQGEPPQLPQFSPAVDVAGPAAPAVDVVLVDRIPAGTFTSSQYNSQDFAAPQDDSQAADDFCIPAGDASWSITRVDVVGGYNFAGYQPSAVNVFFMAKNAGPYPGTGLYTATIPAASVGNLATGSFALTLPTPLLLGGHNCYWLSVQAVQPGGLSAGQSWQWITHNDTQVDGVHSTYRKPQDPNSTCNTWAVRAFPCAPADSPYPDFTYRLSGSVSTDNATPHIYTMSPAGALAETVNLGLTGVNFAPGATLSWTVNSSTEVITTTVIDGGHLTAVIPAEIVGPQGNVASVRVNNPPACQDGACTSNAKAFVLENFFYVFLPLVRR